MFDDFDGDILCFDDAYEEHMREASALLAECIYRARNGLPLRTSKNLAKVIRIDTRWLPEDVKRVKDMRARGLTAAQIARAMDRTIDSVKGVIYSKPKRKKVA